MSFISCGVMPCLPVILTEDWGPDRLQYRPGCADHALQCQDLPEPQDQAYVSGLHVEIFDSQLGQQVWNCVKANNGLNCVNWFLKFSFVVWNCVFVNAKDQHVVSLGGQVRVKWLVAQRNSQLGLTCHEWAFMIVEKHWCHIRYPKSYLQLVKKRLYSRSRRAWCLFILAVKCIINVLGQLSSIILWHLCHLYQLCHLCHCKKQWMVLTDKEIKVWCLFPVYEPMLSCFI